MDTLLACSSSAMGPEPLTGTLQAIILLRKGFRAPRKRWSFADSLPERYARSMSRRSRAHPVTLPPICLALLLSACQSHPKPASTAETLGAAGSYLVCLHDAAAALDDGMSDVSQIAPAVADRCKPAFEAGIEAITRGMSPLEAAIVRHKAERENMKLAAAAVHEERLEKKRDHR